MADEVDLGTLVAWLRRFDERVQDERAHLTKLDSAIGDADHGANMARGMAAVRELLDGADTSTGEATIGGLFKKAGMTLVSKVGGASGPLYGTFLLRFGSSGGDRTSLDADGLADALDAALGGVVARGKAEAGDKTMVDAIEPAVAAMRDAIDGDQPLAAAVAAAAEAAAAGRDATEPMRARKGRASYLGERSEGHLDPGATSSALLFRALADAVESAG